MFLYHQATATAAEDALKNGLQLTTKREMGNSPDIKKADDYLDAHRPAGFIAAGIRRGDNIYAFIGDRTALIDITNGRQVPLSAYQKPGYVLLRLETNEEACYVSDLDLYDAVKAAVDKGKDAEKLATAYWQHLIPLRNYRPGSIRRPEVMIVRPVPAPSIHRVA